MKVFVELRARLGSANVYIVWPELDAPFSVCASQKENALLIRDIKGEKTLKSLTWPSNGGQIRKDNFPPVFSNDKGICSLLVVLKEPSVTLLQQPLTESSCQTDAVSCHVKKSMVDSTVSGFCANCGHTVVPSMDLARLLPLPSMDWRDHAHDWFCGCSHTTQKPQEGNLRSLPQSQVGAKNGDILYSHGFICLNQSHLANECLKEEEEEEEGLLTCPNCSSSVGTTGTTVQLWHHTVTFEWPLEKNNRDLSLETFFKVTSGLAKENQPPLKLSLQCPEKEDLFVWILEPRLAFFEWSEERDKFVMKKAMKVLWCDSNREAHQGTQCVKLPQTVVEAGAKHLLSSQDMLAPGQRQDGQFKIGLIVSDLS